MYVDEPAGKTFQISRQHVSPSLTSENLMDAIAIIDVIVDAHFTSVHSSKSEEAQAALSGEALPRNDEVFFF